MTQTPRDERPNFLIFLVDQVQADVVAPDHPCLMPNVSRLASEGIRFTRNFGPSPHCCPSRATFMSGLYPSRHGVYNNVNTGSAFQRGLNPGVRLFSEYLRDAGYDLAHAGKWHVSDEETPADRGWRELSTYQKHLRTAHEKKLKDARSGWTEPGPRQHGQILHPGWRDFQAHGAVREDAGAYEEAHYYQYAVKPGVEALAELSKSNGPWALCVSTDMGPGSSVPSELAELYEAAKVDLPASFRDTMEDKPRVYQRMRHQLWGQLTVDEARESIAHYWALCSLEDRYFGEFLAALDTSGQADNTFVLFVGDHGDCCFAHGLSHMGIQSFRECYNVPGVVRWPRGIKHPGREVDALVSLADFAPTFLELAGCQVQQRLTGRSLVPFLCDTEPNDWPDAWYSQTKGNECYFTQRIVQTRAHKYVCNWFDFDELYDLKADPHEMVNLAFPDRVEQPEVNPASAEGNICAPWPRLAEGLDEVRRDLLAKMWAFADQEDDIIFNDYPPVALAPYGPHVRWRLASGGEL